MNHVASQALRQLFGSYFHQDWRAEFATPERALEAFLQGSEPATAARAAAELTRLLSQVRRESALRAALERLGCYYEPASAAQTWREWLLAVLQTLESRREPVGGPS